MEVSTVIEEFVTEKTFTKIVFNGHEDIFVELAPPDIVCCEAVVSVTLYFETDIGGSLLKQALQTAGEEYYELFGRLVPHPMQCFQSKVDSDGWFPFVEQSCNCTLREALTQHVQVQANLSKEEKATLVKPQLSQHMDIDQLKNGKEPVFKCKLTHFVDGPCALVFAFSHLLVDGQRFVHLLVDIGKAARGLDMEPKIHDRSLMWPDSFLSKIQTPDLDPTKFPRIVSAELASLDVSTLTGQTETLFSHFLHFPEEFLQRLKKTLSVHLPQGEYLSTVDIVTALMWLACCEADVADSTEKTLPERLKESLASQCLEGHKNGASWVPSNYSGNAMFSLSLKYQENETDLEKDSLLEMLLNATLTVRRGVLGVRGHQARLAEHLSQSYPLLNDVTLFQRLTSPFKVMFMSSLSKLGFEDINFGAGKPCFINCPCETPLGPKLFFILPGLKSGGVFVSTYVSKSKQNSFFNSHVLKECASGVNFVFGKDSTKPEFNLQL